MSKTSTKTVKSFTVNFSDGTAREIMLDDLIKWANFIIGS
jgi:hypothetical protein